MKKRAIFEGEHPIYHVYGRGVEKRNVFLDNNDGYRFLFLLCLLQGDVFFNHVFRLAMDFKKFGVFALKDIEKEILDARMVELISFVLMPNHYHLIVQETQENGLSKFMSRFGNSYTKYFNLRHKRSGYLFSSHFHKILVDTNDYLLHLSAYAHRNPRELAGWRGSEHKYLWSSYQDYIGENRFGLFLNRTVILDQFSNPDEYYDFVKSSKAKDHEDILVNLPG